MSSPLSIRDWPLSYEARLDARSLATIDLVVIHCTELPDMAMAREFGERIRHPATRTGNSGHYYIDTDGTTWRFVHDERIAHHTFGFNARSTGIELSNRGRYPHWQDSRHQAFTAAYPAVQIEALLALLRHLRSTLASLKFIAGHEELDRRVEPASDDPAILLPRRRDPGPLFPWSAIVPTCGLERFQPVT